MIKRNLHTLSTSAALLFIPGAVLAVLGFFIVYHATFLFGDDVQFLQTTAVGKYLPISNYIFPGVGRFLPLTLWDFNILNLIPGGESATAHFSLVAASFVLLFVFTYLLFATLIRNNFGKNRYVNWITSLIVIFVLSRFYSVFLELHFSERMVVVLLNAFLFFALKFLDSEKLAFGIAALLTACYLTYCKEPVFVVFLVIPFVYILFNRKGLTTKKKLFFYMLILNAIIYLLLYYLLVYRSTTVYYSGGNISMAADVLAFKVFRSHKILLLALLVASIRFYYVFFKKDKTHLFHDGALFAGVAYTLLILIIGLNFSYYYFPAVVLCLPALLLWSLKLLNMKLVTLIMFVAASYSLIMTIPDIRENQKRRVATAAQMAQISALIADGYTLVWYQTKPGLLSRYNQSISSWKKISMETYLQYIQKKAEPVQLKACCPSHDSVLKHKTIVFYPSENDSNTTIKNDFEQLRVQKQLVYLSDFEGIKTFTLQ